MKRDRILLDHGSGGMISHNLTSDILLPLFDNPILSCLDDGAIFEINGTRMALSTDTFTVDPIFFPGGNIGDLAVNGTVNDISMCGATPLYLSMALILEEGFPMKHFEIILKSMRTATKKADVILVTGDTKVVPKGAADKIFINTSGIGIIPEGVNIAGSNAQPGDKIILSGCIADHGVTVLTQRKGMSFSSSLESDSAALNHMVQDMLAVTKDIHVLRDPTRGGVGTTLNEIAEKSDVGIKIYEDKIPIHAETLGICELLGFDPLYLANEGKLLSFVAPGMAQDVLSAIRSNPLGKKAAIIGEVVDDNRNRVYMKTIIGGTRIVDMLAGEQLPRIC